MKILEAQADRLVSDAEAKALSKELGIIDEEDAGYRSPDKKGSRKFDPKDEEAAKAAKELAARMAAERKEMKA